jgi:hypothetical protein
MKRRSLAPRVLILAVLFVVALAASSCDSASGMGVGVGPPARWGGSSSSPPVFVGGPAY